MVGYWQAFSEHLNKRSQNFSSQASGKGFSFLLANGSSKKKNNIYVSSFLNSFSLSIAIKQAFSRISDMSP